MRFISLVVLGFLAVSGLWIESAKAGIDNPLVLEKFFMGKLSAQGHFTNVWTGARRDLKVQMQGKWNGVTLTLKEDFVYSDGETDQKTWNFTKLNDKTYVGTREDVVKEAEINAVDGDILLSYVAKVGGLDLNFKDRLTQIDAKTVRNTADVSFLGFIKVGEVELTITRNGH
jgi:hypothetical protein